MSEQSAAAFLLDTNVFIEAYRRYYAMDLCPGFWDCLEHYSQEAYLLSIDRVREEIDEGDPLNTWVSQAPDKLFASTADEQVIRSFGNMMRWVQGNDQFSQQAENEFARVADGWLVAYAEVYGLTVVTHETLKPEAQKRVPIPNVCRHFNVPYQDTFSMLRALDVTFGWK